jgi:hypothetical protein
MNYYPHMDEKQRTLAAIIDVLNNIDVELRELERISSSPVRVAPFLTSDVMVLVEKFFFHCQIAEDKMKEGYTRRYVTKSQIDDLNRQLRQSVSRMRDLSARSSLVAQVLREKFGVDTAGSAR